MKFRTVLKEYNTYKLIIQPFNYMQYVRFPFIHVCVCYVVLPLLILLNALG